MAQSIVDHLYDLRKWQLVLGAENSVFQALESPFYLLCVIFSLLHFFSVDGPRGGGMAQVAQW